jgi:uncharacterized protein
MLRLWPRALVLFILAALLIGAAYAATNFPALTGRVVDDAHILTPVATADLERKLADLEQKSQIQLVVATVPSLDGQEIEPYANALFRAWKLGEAKQNNGALLLIAPKERRMRIEVGYGLEGTLTDALSSVIVSSAIIPRFKTNDFSGGIERGVDGIISVLSDDSADWQPQVNVRSEDPSADFDKLFPILFFAIVIFIMWYLIRHANGPPSAGSGRGGRSVFVPYGGSWGSSGWGGGGFGGGFSGGGGSSGGGGASGSW